MDNIRSCPIQKFTQQDLELVADRLEINPGDYPELLTGMQEELEHCSWTEGDVIISARIALDHLREDAAYYSKLKGAGL